MAFPDLQATRFQEPRRPVEGERFFKMSHSLWASFVEEVLDGNGHAQSLRHPRLLVDRPVVTPFSRRLSAGFDGYSARTIVGRSIPDHVVISMTLSTCRTKCC